MSTTTTDILYRGYTIRPAYRGVVAVIGPRGDSKGRFVDTKAARTWIDALLGVARRS